MSALTDDGRLAVTPRMAWLSMDIAPHTGEWLLLDVEDGSTDCTDHPTSSVYVGRWNPKNFPDLGKHFYEWEVVDRYPDGLGGDGETTTHYAAGRIGGWMSMPGNLQTSAK